MKFLKQIKNVKVAGLKSATLIVCLLMFVSCTAKNKQSTTESPVDNSAINVRDKTQVLPTPPDQMENELDLNITSKIRQLLTSDDTLSVDAKNVKIISQNGVITLRGPVKSIEEKNNIASKAEQVDGVKSVNNMIDIVTQNQQ